MSTRDRRMTVTPVPAKAVMYVVKLGGDRGEVLVTVWPSGKVEGDWREESWHVWTPLGLVGGNVRTERMQ